MFRGSQNVEPHTKRPRELSVPTLWREGKNQMGNRGRESNRKGERCAAGVPSMEKINGGLRDLQKGRGKKRVEGPGKKLGQPNTLRPGLESRERIRGRGEGNSFRRFYFPL